MKVTSNYCLLSIYLVSLSHERLVYVVFDLHSKGGVMSGAGGTGVTCLSPPAPMGRAGIQTRLLAVGFQQDSLAEEELLRWEPVP